MSQGNIGNQELDAIFTPQMHEIIANALDRINAFKAIHSDILKLFLKIDRQTVSISATDDQIRQLRDDLRAELQRERISALHRLQQLSMLETQLHQSILERQPLEAAQSIIDAINQLFEEINIQLGKIQSDLDEAYELREAQRTIAALLGMEIELKIQKHREKLAEKRLKENQEKQKKIEEPCRVFTLFIQLLISIRKLLASSPNRKHNTANFFTCQTKTDESQTLSKNNSITNST